MRHLLLAISPIHGRINRKRYALYWLLGPILFATDVLGLAIMSVLKPDGNPLFVTLPVMILWIYTITAANVKRLHDRDKKGIWALAGVLFFPLGILIIIQNFILPGTPGPNRFD